MKFHNCHHTTVGIDGIITNRPYELVQQLVTKQRRPRHSLKLSVFYKEWYVFTKYPILEKNNTLSTIQSKDGRNAYKKKILKQVTLSNPEEPYLELQETLVTLKDPKKS